MSDFDKEAEREKLREKYERDKKEREATQRMSDLLLKGARMTNSHCDACGDPLFEQNGATFCPSCHGGPEGVQTNVDAQPEETAGGGNAATADGTTDETAGESGTSESTTSSKQGSASPEDVTTMADTAGDEPSQPPESSRNEPTASQTPQIESNSLEPARASAREPAPDRSDDHRQPSTVAVEGDLESARDALIESLEKFARKAAETDDPRHARDCLEAAREASEALSALR